jgi:hypothetical protein
MLKKCSEFQFCKNFPLRKYFLFTVASVELLSGGVLLKFDETEFASLVEEEQSYESYSENLDSEASSVSEDGSLITVLEKEVLADSVPEEGGSGIQSDPDLRKKRVRFEFEESEERSISVLGRILEENCEKNEDGEKEETL